MAASVNITQVVGAPCVMCGQVIRIALEGEACLACAGVFHTACVAQAGLCPRCGQDCAAQQRALLAGAQVRRTQALDWGRKTLLVVIVVLLATPVIGLQERWLAGRLELPHFLPLFAHLLCLALLVVGQNWARLVFAWSTLITSLVLLRQLNDAWPVQGLDAMTCLLLALLSANVLASVLLFGSTRMQAYLRSLRANDP